MTAPDARPERVWLVGWTDNETGQSTAIAQPDGTYGGVPYVPESRLREVEAEREALKLQVQFAHELADDKVEAMREQLAALRAEVARLTDALGLCGVNAGSVNGVPKWWHVAADDSEPIHDTVEDAANAAWAVREALRAERDTLVPLARLGIVALDDDDGRFPSGDAIRLGVLNGRFEETSVVARARALLRREEEA